MNELIPDFTNEFIPDGITAEEVEKVLQEAVPRPHKYMMPGRKKSRALLIESLRKEFGLEGYTIED